MTHYPAAHHSRRRGFTLAETLVALSITALLMLAMGGAFTAAGNSVEQNDRFFRSEQQARVTMDLMMGVIRRCQAVTSVTYIGPSASGTSITLTPSSGDFSGHSLTFTYNASNAGSNPGTITMTDNIAGTTAVLASDVISASFNTITQNNFKTVALNMTVQIDQNQVTVSDSAAPRILMTGTQWN